MTALLVVGIVVALFVGFGAGTGVTRRRLSGSTPPAPGPPAVVEPPAAVEPAAVVVPEPAAVVEPAAEPAVVVEPVVAPEAAVDADARNVLEAIWQLQRLEMEVHRRREAELSTASEPIDGPVGLAQALRQEIERVREEIGTPGGFTSDLSVEPDPAMALLVLRSTQSTLDVLVRRSQAFDLHLGAAGPRLDVTVLCEDFDGANPDTDPIAEAIAGAGGALELDRDTEGRLRAHLSVPTG